MKQKTITILISAFILLILSLLSSLLFSTLYYFHLISYSQQITCLQIFSMISYAISGGYLGKMVTNKLLLHALPIILILLILSFFTLNHFNSYLFFIIKFIIYLISALFIFHHKKR